MKTKVVVSIRYLTHDEWLEHKLWGGQWRLLELECGHYLLRDRPLSRSYCKQCEEADSG